ncbi:MAG: hypothetical protein GJT30_03555 [Geobacter sp.]|nr:hypothetical protein [Geobacter sp.]
MSSNDNRDDFTQDTIARLRLRVAGRCSNPACRVPTTGPTSDPQKVNNIGVAAHICAAAPGGPRYNTSMTSEQRKDIENGIWLCSSCSTDIDRDPVLYKEDVLHQWKAETERLAREEMGKKLPDKNDAINTVAAALTGLPTSFIPNAIENVCVASSRALENLDPRFQVKASYEKGHTAFSIYAKENVKGNLVINSEFGQEFTDKYKDLIAHGKTLEIDSRAIKITGSKLLEEIFTEAKKGVFQIIPSLRKPASQKLWLVSNDKSDIFILDDLVGEITLGEDSFSFKGYAFNRLLEFSFTHLHSDINLKDLNFSIIVDFNCWNGQQVSSMQYFDKIYKFFELLIVQEWQLLTKFEIEGREIFTGKSPNFGDGLRNLYVTFRYIYLAKEVLKYMGIELQFNSNFEYSEEVHDLLWEIYKVATGQNVYSVDDINDNPRCVLIADEQLTNISYLSNVTEAVPIKIEQHITREIDIFGQKIAMPPLIHTFTKVKPRLIGDISSIMPNQEVPIEWVPEKDCQYIITLMT